MVQTVYTYLLPAGKKRIMFEKPLALHRIFFSVCVLTGTNAWYDFRMSFDDPMFRSFYMLNGPAKYFKAEGADIFKGDIWVLNVSGTDLRFTATEILR